MYDPTKLLYIQLSVTTSMRVFIFNEVFSSCLLTLYLRLWTQQRKKVLPNGHRRTTTDLSSYSVFLPFDTVILLKKDKCVSVLPSRQSVRRQWTVDQVTRLRSLYDTSTKSSTGHLRVVTQIKMEEGSTLKFIECTSNIIIPQVFY